METRNHLTPWLASVVVRPASRGQGIGSVLVRDVMQMAAVQGWESIYLVTPDAEQFYARLGWSIFEEDVKFHGLCCTLMVATVGRQGLTRSLSHYLGAGATERSGCLSHGDGSHGGQVRAHIVHYGLPWLVL